MKKIKVAVSACLLGQNVRYDGGNKFMDLNTYLNAEIFDLQPICPEVEMGLTVPRPPIQIINDNSIRLVQAKYPENDLTQQMHAWFDRNLNHFKQYSGFILKSKSPSCGYQTTPHYQKNQQTTVGNGLFVHLLRKNFTHVPIIDEIKLMCLNTCSNFIQAIQK
jgi:uncharacterized protein YbbK (DUF523 family)